MDYVKLVEKTNKAIIDSAILTESDELSGLSPAKKKVLKDIIALSDGTIATLTGLNKSSDVMQFVDAWIGHIAEKGMKGKTWHDSFHEFVGKKVDKITKAEAMKLSESCDDFSNIRDLLAENSEEIADVLLSLISEEKVTEGSVASKEDLMEYAMTLGKKAFGDDLDEKKIKGIVDKAIKDSDGDWEKAAGFVTGSFNS
jgi:hypothetical protein